MPEQKSMLRDAILFTISIITPIIIYTVITWYFVLNINPFDSFIDIIMMALKVFWYGGIILVPSSFFAFIKYGSPFGTDQRNLEIFNQEGWNQSDLLNIVYVSKGSNVQSITRSVQKTLNILHETKTNYRLEIVTDIAIHEYFPAEITSNNLIHFIEVPYNYTTKNGALYKARALHYALEYRDISHPSNHIFHLHLDEESQITNELIAGLHIFLKEPANRESVGQGEIKYNAHNYGQNKLITAIDSIRTGDDLGRFRFQLKFLHKPLFGLHGSFLFIPDSIERDFGFDLGGRGSITEDAYFALIAAERGVRFNWIDGHIREQSPFTLGDILRQRKRWISGLEMLAEDPIISFKTRLPLRINLVLWEITWISILITTINIAIGGSYYPGWLSYVAGFLTGGYISLYTVGAYRNLMDMDFSLIKKLLYYILIFLLVPVAALVEAVAVIYALLFPMTTFEIVKK